MTHHSDCWGRHDQALTCTQAMALRDATMKDRFLCFHGRHHVFVDGSSTCANPGCVRTRGELTNPAEQRSQTFEHIDYDDPRGS